jgi:hypothetical protein
MPQVLIPPFCLICRSAASVFYTTGVTTGVLFAFGDCLGATGRGRGVTRRLSVVLPAVSTWNGAPTLVMVDCCAMRVLVVTVTDSSFCDTCKSGMLMPVAAKWLLLSLQLSVLTLAHWAFVVGRVDEEPRLLIVPSSYFYSFT